MGNNRRDLRDEARLERLWHWTSVACFLSAGMLILLPRRVTAQGPRAAPAQKVASPMDQPRAPKPDAAPDLIRTFRFPPYGVNKLAVSPDGARVAAGVLARVQRNNLPLFGAVLWDVQTGKQLRVLERAPGPTGPSWALAFSPDNTRLASGNAEGTVTIWNVRTGKVEHTLTVSRDHLVVEVLAFSPDGQTIAAGVNTGRIQLWDVRTGTLKRTFQDLTTLNAVAFSPDGKLLAGGSGVSMSGIEADLRKMKVGELKVGEAGLTRDVGELRVWDLQSGRTVWQRSGGQPEFVNSLVFSPDSKTLVAGGEQLRAWEAPSGAPRWTQQGRPPKQPDEWPWPIISIAYSPDGQVLASSSGRNVKSKSGSGYTPFDDLELWDPTTGRRMRTLASVREMHATLVAFATTGRLIWCGESMRDILESSEQELTVRSWKGVGGR